MKNWITLIGMLVGALSLLSSCKEDEAPAADFSIPEVITTASELTEVLENIYETSGAPGFALNVVQNNAIVYQHAFGYANLESQQPYTNETFQPIGSISKTFIAAAIVKAIEESYFTLDTDISDILPVELRNPKFPDAPILVRHLVTHTSSLIDDGAYYIQSYHVAEGEDLSTAGAQLLTQGFGVEQRATEDLDDYLANYYLADGDGYAMSNFANVAPGAKWNYSNIASSLAAYLIEAATGVPFDEYVDNKILQPLGMTHTAYNWYTLEAVNAATLYWDAATPLPHYANDSYPDGSINTSNEDLGNYLLAMLKGAQGQNEAILSQESWELLFAPLLEVGITPAALGENQSVFWTHAGDYIFHDGSDPGTTCNLIFNPSLGVGYSLMTTMDVSTDDKEENWYALIEQIEAAIAAYQPQ